jgi:hypothetical protein
MRQKYKKQLEKKIATSQSNSLENSNTFTNFNLIEFKAKIGGGSYKDHHHQNQQVKLEFLTEKPFRSYSTTRAGTNTSSVPALNIPPNSTVPVISEETPLESSRHLDKVKSLVLFENNNNINKKPNEFESSSGN